MTETLTGELLVRKVQPEGDRSVAEADLRSQGSSTDYELDLVADRLPHSGHDDAVLDAPVGEEYDDMDNSSTRYGSQKTTFSGGWNCHPVSAAKAPIERLLITRQSSKNRPDTILWPTRLD